MFYFIKNYFFAKAVCKKYNLKFKLTTSILKSSNSGSNKVIYCNPFSKMFIPVFLHEIGHHITIKYRKNEYSDPNNRWYISLPINWTYVDSGRKVYQTLPEEYLASRYSVKAMKKLKICNKNYVKYLQDAFNSYFIQLVNLLNQKQIADIHYKAYRYIGSDIC